MINPIPTGSPPTGSNPPDTHTQTLEQIFSSIDKKLKANDAKSITQEEIDRVYAYYEKEKFRFNQDQSQFIKPGKRKKETAPLDLEF